MRQARVIWSSANPGWKRRLTAEDGRCLGRRISLWRWSGCRPEGSRSRQKRLGAVAVGRAYAAAGGLLTVDLRVVLT